MKTNVDLKKPATPPVNLKGRLVFVLARCEALKNSLRSLFKLLEEKTYQGATPDGFWVNKLLIIVREIGARVNTSNRLTQEDLDFFGFLFLVTALHQAGDQLKIYKQDKDQFLQVIILASPDSSNPKTGPVHQYQLSLSEFKDIFVSAGLEKDGNDTVRALGKQFAEQFYEALKTVPLSQKRLPPYSRKVLKNQEKTLRGLEYGEPLKEHWSKEELFYMVPFLQASLKAKEELPFVHDALAVDFGLVLHRKKLELFLKEGKKLAEAGLSIADAKACQKLIFHLDSKANLGFLFSKRDRFFLNKERSKNKELKEVVHKQNQELENLRRELGLRDPGLRRDFKSVNHQNFFFLVPDNNKGKREKE